MNVLHNKKFKLVLLILMINLSISAQTNHEKFTWPNTPASLVFQDFLTSYNTGNIAQLRKFIIAHYLTKKSVQNISSESVQNYIRKTVDYWADLYHRYGPILPHSLSINKPHHIEVWVQGSITKYWFAPEFILNNKTSKIRATGLLQGFQPKSAIHARTKHKKAMIKKFKKYLSEVEKEGYFQGAVIVQQGDDILLRTSYGFKDIESKARFQIDTRSNIASITKMITAVACLQLVQNGLLNLKAPISNYLPELPKNIAEVITLEKLLNHTSGYELDNIDGFREALSKTTSIQEVYKTHLKYIPKWEHYTSFTLPTRFDYSNDSYDLIAVIIERISGLSFSDYLEKNIYNPLGMKHTSFKKYNAASYYRYFVEVDGLKKLASNNMGVSKNISAAAGIYSNVDDLRIFFNALFKTYDLLDLAHRSILLSPSILNGTAFRLEEQTSLVLGEYKKTKRKNSRSAGLGISYDVVLNFGHNGTGLGVSGELRYFPEQDYFLVILCNNRSGSHIAFNYFKNILPKK